MYILHPSPISIPLITFRIQFAILPKLKVILCIWLHPYAVVDEVEIEFCSDGSDEDVGTRLLDEIIIFWAVVSRFLIQSPIFRRRGVNREKSFSKCPLIKFDLINTQLAFISNELVLWSGSRREKPLKTRKSMKGSENEFARGTRLCKVCYTI